MTLFLDAARMNVAATDPSVLNRIAEAEVSVARWCRPVPPLLTAALAVADLSGFARHDVEAAPEELQRDWAVALANAGLPHGLAALLSDDAVGLARHFAAALAVLRVRLRLERITGDSCKRFHADNMAARLITTYRGAGTQWLTPAAAAAVVDGQVSHRTPIEQLTAGEVAIMKGRLWPPGQPLVHRSPPIAGSGIERIVLVIDVAPSADSS